MPLPNFIVKTDSDLTYNQDLNRVTSGLELQTIVGAGGKYNIDLYGAMSTFMVAETPLLAFLYNFGTESANSPYIHWADEYTGMSWVDIGFDELRLRDSAETISATAIGGTGATVTKQMYAPNSSSYVGGKYVLEGGSALGTTSSYDTIGEVFPAATLNVNKALIGTLHDNFGVSGVTKALIFRAHVDTCTPISGNITNVAYRLRQQLLAMGYTDDSHASTDAFSGYTFSVAYSSTAKAPLYFAFDDLFTHVNATLSTYHEVLVRIEKVVLLSNSLYIILNFDQCNHNITTGSKVLLASFPTHVDTAVVTLDTDFDANVSHPSRMVQIGIPTKAPLAIPEGDNFVRGRNISKHIEHLMNFTQIFQSDAYGITGTHQASTFRFVDDFIRTREFHLDMYKKTKVAAFLYGIKGEQRVASSSNTTLDGQIARTTGGLLDYGLFPITYMKVEKPSVAFDSTASTLKTIFDWLNRIGDGLMAFRVNSNKAINLLCSQKTLDYLDIFVRTSLATNALMGGLVQKTAPSVLSLGLEVTTFKTTKGLLINFIHEPSLDYMVSFPVAYHQFNTANVDPKDILISVDPANMKQCMLRPDKIYGNIQDNGEDIFLEGMRGETGFKIRFPKNFAILYAPNA